MLHVHTDELVLRCTIGSVKVCYELYAVRNGVGAALVELTRYAGEGVGPAREIRVVGLDKPDVGIRPEVFAANYTELTVGHMRLRPAIYEYVRVCDHPSMDVLHNRAGTRLVIGL